MTSTMNTTKEHVNVNANGSEETMSKSKKKRMKRAKAKQRKEQQEENNANGLPHNSLNPLDVVRADIVKLGYELRFVDQAMDEMWTNQLDYSDKDTVLAYIEEKERNLRDAIGPNNATDADADNDASTDTDHNTDVFSEMNSNVRKNSSADADSPTPTEASSNPSMNLSSAAVSACALNESSAAIQGSSALENEGPSDHVNHDHGHGIEESPAGNQSPVSIPEQIQHGSSTNHNNTNNNDTDKKKPKGQGGKPLTLFAKLDIVAQSPNLTDGIIALTEWVVKAAAPTQIMELCSPNTNALRSIMKRIILSGDGKYTGQLLDLVGTILRTVGAPSKQLVSSAKALGVLLKRASDACLDDSLVTEDTKNGIAVSVSNHAVKIVGSVVKSLIQDSNASVYSSKDLEADMHQLLQGSISTSSKKSTEKNVMNLMEDRDKSKSVAEKYSALVQATIQESQGDASNSQSDSSKDADTLAKPLQETDVVKDMLGEEYESVATSKTKLATLKSREEEIATSNPERMELVNIISTYQAGKEKVATRVEQLRAELLKLEQEEKEFDQQIQESESKLLEMDGASSEEAKQVKQEMSIVSQKVEVEACVSQVAKQLCQFDSAMKAVLNLKADERDAKVENSEDSATSPGKVLSGYLKVMSFYFSSELSVLSYVKARAEKIETDTPILVSFYSLSGNALQKMIFR
jgi:hypothetical protein